MGILIVRRSSAAVASIVLLVVLVALPPGCARTGLDALSPYGDASVATGMDSGTGADVARDSPASGAVDATVDASATDAASDVVAEAGRTPPSIKLAAGGGVVCAIVRGALECWGRNDVGQLGRGTVDSLHGGAGMNPATLAPAIVPGLAPTMVTAGGGWDTLENHVCAGDGRQTSCWGNDDDFALGHDLRFDVTDAACAWNTRCCPAPVPVAGIVDVVEAIAAGPLDTCAIVGAERAVECWGDNSWFQLAEGYDAMPRDNGGWGTSVPTPIPGLTGIAEVGVGVDSVCARAAADGSIWCWGLNEYGQLGTGLSGAGADGSFLDTSHHLPSRVAGVSGSVSLSVGNWQACAALADGSVVCWGLDDGDCTGTPGGQLGHAPETDPTCFHYWLCDPTPTVVAGLPAAREVVAGFFESCAVLRDDTVACWGTNAWDQLGHDPSLDEDSGCGPYRWQPTLVSGLSNVAHVALHDLGGCAVTWDDRVLCWGLVAVDVDGAATRSASAVEVTGL